MDGVYVIFILVEHHLSFLLTSIFTFFLLGEIRNLTTLSLLPLVNNCFSLSSFFQSLLYFLWIGAQDKRFTAADVFELLSRSH